MSQTTFLLSISKGKVLPILTLVMTPNVATNFSCPSVKGGVEPLTLKCMTTDFANDFSLAH